MGWSVDGLAGGCVGWWMGGWVRGCVSGLVTGWLVGAWVTAWAAPQAWRARLRPPAGPPRARVKLSERPPRQVPTSLRGGQRGCAGEVSKIMPCVQDRAASGPFWRPWNGLLEPLKHLGRLRPEARFLLSMPIENADFLSWRASRRPETFLSNGPCIFHTFDLQPNRQSAA